ncbi:undecaprenyl-phosphate alpha-N-acetylglucosaminyl 1-phosphate transferase [Bacteroidia bacterium]|nr:undecaprenyl-phosphate alpha-N-acetylglucosaminyl 1-phosphate transferase [Bacteroidia bacterium]
MLPSINSLARTKGLLDMPGERTSHKKKTPRFGGVSLFLSIWICSLFFFDNNDMYILRFVLLSSIIIFAIGLRDDIIPIPPNLKFAIQLICAAIIVYSGLGINDLYGVLGITTINSTLAMIITILFIVYTINAINLIDGIDGLLIILSIIAFFIFGIFFTIRGFYNWGILCGSAIGSLFTILHFNIFGRKNKTFLGDCGSLLLGLLITSVALKFYQLCSPYNTAVFLNIKPIPVVLSVLIVPLFDTARVFLLRLIYKMPY